MPIDVGERSKWLTVCVKKKNGENNKDGAGAGVKKGVESDWNISCTNPPPVLPVVVIAHIEFALHEQ